MEKIILYLLLITSLFGSVDFLNLDIGLFFLDPFRICIAILGFLLINNLIRNFKMLEIREYFKKLGSHKYSYIFMAFWLIYAVLSVVWTNDYRGWINAVYYISLGLISAIAFYHYFSNNFEMLTAIRVIVIMVMFHNVVGWYEIFTGKYLFLPPDRVEIFAIDGAPVSSFFNVNDYATFMMFGVCFSIICLYNANSTFKKMIYLMTLLSSTLLVIASDSRANIIGLIMSFTALMFFLFKKKYIKYILLTLLAVFIAMLLINPMFVSGILNLIDSLFTFNFEFAYESVVTGSEYRRINLIRNGFLFLKKTLGFGVGAGNFEYWMMNYAVYDTNGIINMHNWWMEILICYGVIIFIMYIVFFCNIFLSTLRKYYKTKCRVTKSISLGILCFMISFVVGSTSSSSNITKPWLWLVWGMIIAFQLISSENCSDTNEFLHE